MNDHLIFLLGKCVDLDALLKNNKELFNAKNLNHSEKTVLLRDFQDYYQLLFMDTINTPEERALLICTTNAHINFIHNEIKKFTDDELLKVSDATYVKLVIRYPNYLRKNVVDKKGVNIFKRIVYKNPNWIFNTYDQIPENVKLASCTVNHLLLSYTQKSIKYIEHFLKHAKLSSMTWCKLIQLDEKYRQVFIDNINNLPTESEIRAVFYEHPELLKLLTPDVIADSKLSAKKWLLLIKYCKNNDKLGLLKDWEMSDELIEAFRLDLMAETLSGKSSNTAKLRAAVRELLNEKSNETVEEVDQDEKTEEKPLDSEEFA